MKRTRKRWFAALTALAMAFAMMPMTGQTAYADDPATNPDAINLGAGVLAVGMNTSGAATVYMADCTWRIIGYDGQGVAGKADAMTLIASKSLTTSYFRKDVGAPDANHYGKSDLKKEIDKLTGANGIFSAGEKAGIVPRTLATGSHIPKEPYTEGIAGEEVKDALLWPLSIREAYYTGDALRKGGRFWLRSPGDYKNQAGLVGDGGAILFSGYIVDTRDGGVRPAFHYDLNAVIFTSAAVDGKSTDVGADSLAAPGQVSGDTRWKLTVKDSAHKDFGTLGVTTSDRKNWRIPYEKAVTGDNEYISAIITSSDGKIKYYGKLGLASDAADAYVEVNTDGKLQTGDTLYVFNEQCNGDNKTDLSSELVLVCTAPAPPTITEQPQALELTYGDAAGNTLTVQAETAANYVLKYQWYYKNTPNDAEGTKIANATGAAYTIPSNEPAGTRYYYCEVTAAKSGGAEWDKAAAVSATAKVTIGTAPITFTAENKTCEDIGKTNPFTCAVTSGTWFEAKAPDLAFKVTDSNDNEIDPKTAPEGKYTITASWASGKENGNYNATFMAGEFNTAHDWGDWTKTADPQVGKAGERQRTCKSCGEIEKEPIAALIGFFVTFDANGHGTAPAAQPVETGKTATEPAEPSESGWKFEGWYTEAACTNAFDFSTPITDNIILYAKWTRTGGGGGGVTTQYTLTYQTNGGSEVKATKHSSGTTVKLTALPTREGYTFDGWYSDAALTDRVTSIRMDGDKTVYAGWKGNATLDHECSAKHLKDVGADAWYHACVDYVIENGLMYGIADDRFGPDVTTSRAMIVTILYHLEGSPAVGGAKPFDDVAAGSWYADAVAWAEEKGIVNGYGNGKFGPDDLITREQFAAILFGYATFKGYDVSKSADLSKYTDAGDISDWALPAMKWANAEGLITGRTVTTLVPKGDATRAEAAAILMQFLENVKK